MIFSADEEKIKDIQKIYEQIPKLYILKSKSDLKKIENPKENQVFAYIFGLKEEIQLRLVHSADQKIIKLITEKWNLFHTSNITRKASLTPNMEIKIGDSSTENIRKMIKIDSGVDINSNNIWLIASGGAGTLNNLSRVLFKGGNMCVDSPYYYGFHSILSHCGVKIIHKDSLAQTTIIERVKQAHSEGAVGYLICSPSNPVGTMLSCQQITQICEWAKEHTDFHLIFDEIYVNTCRIGQTKSAVSYAVSSPNIHVVRGMAKDYGLCRLKIGILISSNPKVIQKFKLWNKIISNHPFTISVINDMLVKSSYGQDIIIQDRQIFKQCFDRILNVLDQNNIKYIEPQAGYFLFTDLRKYLKQNSFEAQHSLWKKIFYKYRVNISYGSEYHTFQSGYYRMCPMIDKDAMIQGLKRIKIALSQGN